MLARIGSKLNTSVNTQKSMKFMGGSYMGGVRMFSKVVVQPTSRMALLESDAINVPLPYMVMQKFLDPARKDTIAQLDGSTNRSLTYSDSYYTSYSFADSLKSIGVKKNDCIAIVSPNHLHYFSCVMGVMLAEAVVSTVNPLYSPEELAHQFEITHAKIVITHPLCLDRVISVVSKDTIVILMDDEISPTDEKFQKQGVIPLSTMMSTKVEKSKNTYSWSHDTFDPHSLAVIPFSSGTTGKSKGVMLTHKNLTCNVLQVLEAEAYTLEAKVGHPQPSLLTPLPFFHIYGFTACILVCLYQGAKLVFLPAFDFKLYLELIQQHRITRSYIVPPVVLALAKHPLVDSYDLSSLQCIMSGAAPLGADVQDACSKRLKCIVKQAWGMTELSPAATMIKDEDIDQVKGNHLGSAGRLLPLTEGKIVDPVTGADLPSSEEGELLIRGPQVMKGYYKDEVSTQRTIRPDGWMHTGDIARFTDDGWLFITDRLKELIKYKGFQVPPAELEAIILSMNEIKDVIVIPVLDDEAGEVPRAYVVKKENAPADFSSDDIIEYVHSRVAPHKRLRGGVIFTDQVPKSASGKLLRRLQIEIDRQAHSASNQ